MIDTLLEDATVKEPRVKIPERFRSVVRYDIDDMYPPERFISGEYDPDEDMIHLDEDSSLPTVVEELYHRKQFHHLKEKGLSDEEYEKHKVLYAAAMEVGIIPRTRLVAERQGEQLHTYRYRYLRNAFRVATDYPHLTDAEQKRFHHLTEQEALFDGLGWIMERVNKPSFNRVSLKSLPYDDESIKQFWMEVDRAREKWIKPSNHTPIEDWLFKKFGMTMLSIKDSLLRTK